MKMENILARYAALLLLLTSCGAAIPAPTATLPAPTTPGIPADSGTPHHFVTDSLLIPTTHAQAQSFALNVDGDSQNRPDNLFGELLAQLTSVSPGLELQSTVDEEVAAGRMVTLHVVQAGDLLNDASATWSIYLGQSTVTAPALSGSDHFTLDPAAPTDSLISGSLTNGHFAGGPGVARLRMAFLGVPIELDLIGVRLEADLSAGGCANGKLGGGVTVDEFRAKVLPALAGGLNLVVEDDQAVAAPLLQAFDADHNSTITSQELENNFLLKLAIMPDLDLLDASGNFDPGQDGVKDTLSLGLGFTCVPAGFAVNGE